MLETAAIPIPITSTSEPSLIFFSKLIPFHHQDYRAISDIFQQASTFSDVVLGDGSHSHPYHQGFIAISDLFQQASTFSGGVLGDGSHSHPYHQGFIAISDLFQQVSTFSGGVLGDGSHSHHHHHDGSAPVGAAAPPPHSPAPSPAFSPSAPYVQAAAAPPPLPASYTPENLAYSNEHSGKTTCYLSQY